KNFLERFPNSSAHDPDTLLGMDLTYDSDHVTLSQKRLIEKGLELAGILECHPVNTPISVGIQLNEATPQERAEFERLKINYRTHTNILNYLSCRTCPDQAPAVSIPSSFNNSPGINHWKQVIHYLTLVIPQELSNTSQMQHRQMTLELGCLEAVQYVSGNLKLKNEITVKQVPSDNMIADALTKSSNSESLERLKARCFLVSVIFSSNHGDHFLSSQVIDQQLNNPL
ncbi:hypothetical protein VP01_1140g3, partial [Puccinia sorghi]